MVKASLVANFVLFQVGWLVAVAGAAYGYPWAGVLYALGFAAWHHGRLGTGCRQELLFVAAAGVLGYIVDSVLALGGFIVFPAHTVLGAPSTLWMVSLWVMFAMTLRHSLGWLRSRYLLAAVLGVAAGPLAYWAGGKLGAIELVDPTRALVAVAAAWAVSMTVLLRLEVLTRRIPDKNSNESQTHRPASRPSGPEL